MSDAYDKSWAEEPSEEHTFRTRIPDEEVALLQGARRVLDLGCGDGTTLAYLESLGFSVVGIDNSRVGVEKARAQLRHGTVLLQDMYEPLPFDKDSFDAVLAYQSLNHNTIENIRGALAEVRRVLKPDGLFSVKVADASTYVFVYHDGVYYDDLGSVFKLIAPRTFLPLAGREQGVVHYDFNEEMLLDELATAGFTILDKQHMGCHLLVNCR